MTIPRLAVTDGYLQSNGIRLHYVEQGQGRPLVLLHGFPETWWSWREQIPVLAEAGYRVIALDLRGYSLSDQSGPYDIDTLADDVRGACAALELEQPTVIGHDWGGAIAWRLVDRYPQLCRQLVVINCPHPARFRLAFRSPRQLARSSYMFFFQLPYLPERTMRADHAAIIMRTFKTMVVDRSRFTPEALAPYRENLMRAGTASAMLGYYRALKAQLFGQLQYGKIATPTLLIWGLADRALGYADVVPGTERWVNHLRLETIVGAGHFVHEEKPDEVNRLLLAFFGESSRQDSHKIHTQDSPALIGSR